MKDSFINLLSIDKHMVTTIKITDDLLPKINQIKEEFGFQTTEEFVHEAVRDKLLELEKRVFFAGSNKIAANLQKKNY